MTYRTGPIGRLARVGLVGVIVLTLLSIVDARGSARFRNPHVLSEPSAWLLHVVMLIVFVILVGAVGSALTGPRSRKRWQVGALVIGATAVVIAAAVGVIMHGSAWGFPLADLVWWFDVLVLVQELLATVLAIALGTPGCEIGVWPELLARVRAGSATTEDALACIVGLHFLDEWERRRVQ